MSDFPPPPPPGGGFPPPPPPGGGFPPPTAPGGSFQQPVGGYQAPGLGGYAPSAGGFSAPKAGFGARLGAALIDGLITGAFSLPGYLYLVAGEKEIGDCPDSLSTDPFAICEVPTSGTWTVAIILFVLGFIAGLVYWAKLDGNSATVGKKAVGIRVVDRTTGQPIGTGRGVGRFFARYLSGFLCGLGYLWMLWDDESQTWHDKIVSSVVVRNP
jgi:uncharacterized RDD family membrane protein YckC